MSYDHHKITSNNNYNKNYNSELELNPYFISGAVLRMYMISFIPYTQPLRLVSLLDKGNESNIFP
jgi:hypothetical protein